MEKRNEAATVLYEKALALAKKAETAEEVEALTAAAYAYMNLSSLRGIADKDVFYDAVIRFADKAQTADDMKLLDALTSCVRELLFI